MRVPRVHNLRVFSPFLAALSFHPALSWFCAPRRPHLRVKPLHFCVVRVTSPLCPFPRSADTLILFPRLTLLFQQWSGVPVPFPFSPAASESSVCGCCPFPSAALAGPQCPRVLLTSTVQLSLLRDRLFPARCFSLPLLLRPQCCSLPMAFWPPPPTPAPQCRLPQQPIHVSDFRRDSCHICVAHLSLLLGPALPSVSESQFRGLCTQSPPQGAWLRVSAITTITTCRK